MAIPTGFHPKRTIATSKDASFNTLKDKVFAITKVKSSAIAQNNAFHNLQRAIDSAKKDGDNSFDNIVKIFNHVNFGIK